MKRNKQAFTLIEILVVVLIIGILAAVALPQYQIAVAKSRYSTLKNLTKSILQAQEVYYLANGHYPNSFTELDIEAPTPTETNEDNTRYYYDWGNCQVYNNEGIEAFVKCSNSQIKLGFQIYAAHNTTVSNEARCVAGSGDLLSVPNRLCKQETNDPSPYKGQDGGSWYAWRYQ
ncbi:MAG: type II secretion system protein [Elusimicrobiaceae bacterium]|nr:type II secretion system protein [Elusimicrobiaceae bacterium]